MSVNTAKLSKTEDSQVRKISLTKLERGGAEPKKGSVIGWECTSPHRGHPYVVRLNKGVALRTSPIREVREQGRLIIIQTLNSVYQVEYLDEPAQA